MRCTTLKASAAKLDGLLTYYAGLAEDRDRPGPARGPVDYYLDPDEPAGRWWGRGLPAVGLSGEVAGVELRALLEARHPIEGSTLGRRFGNSSARGFDATFSAPKSVSALWALTPDQFVRAEVLAAHDQADEAAMEWFETNGAVTRRGRDGVDQVDTNGITAALFRQHTSRTVDPQLHTHAVIAAKVQDPTGKWLSLDARFLKKQQRTIGWLYDAALRGELTRRLGVTWERQPDGPEDGPADMTCIPETVCEALSQRSAQVKIKHDELIRRWSAEHDGDQPDRETIARLERSAAVTSRPSKQHGTDAATLHDTWRTQAREAGLDPDQLTPTNLNRRPAASGISDHMLISEALHHVAEESSTWLRADIARHLAILLPTGDGATATEVVARIDRLATEAEQHCLGLSPERATAMACRRDGSPVAEHVTDRRLTTGAILDQETRLQHWAERNIRPVEPSLLDPQTQAAAAIAATAPLAMVVGPAGTGKTTTTASAVRTLRHEGRPVIGLAPSGKAADVLGTEAGCPTATLASFLRQHRDGHATRWPAGTTVVLDEASMTNTDDLDHLVGLVQRNRWRLVAVGDPAQLPAVGRGGVFAHWCATLPHHELVTPRRFEEPWEAAASLALRRGDPEAAQTYTAHNRIHAAHPALIAGEIAGLHRTHSGAGRTVAITVNTAETARTINVEIQRRIDPAGRRPGVRLADGTRACIGDRIATRHNDRDLHADTGEQVRNRHAWTVTDISPTGEITATHPQRGQVTLPAAYSSDHVELGWAVTGYGNQGDTVDIGLAVLEPGTNRNHAYVALTRGRAANHALIPDPTGTDAPAAQFATMIAHTSDHVSALATQAQLHHDAGLPVPHLEQIVPPGGHQQSTEAGPTRSDPDGPSIEDQVELMQRRLYRLQRREEGRSLSR